MRVRKIHTHGNALSAWIMASAVAFFIVTYTTFFGVALVGLAICYVSTRFELDETNSLGAQLMAQRDLSVEQRLSIRHEHSLGMQSARFFKFFGLGLTVIGVCGGLYYQL
jgi:cytochrome b561